MKTAPSRNPTIPTSRCRRVLHRPPVGDPASGQCSDQPTQDEHDSRQEPGVAHGEMETAGQEDGEPERVRGKHEVQQRLREDGRPKRANSHQVEKVAQARLLDSLHSTADGLGLARSGSRSPKASSAKTIPGTAAKKKALRQPNLSAMYPPPAKPTAMPKVLPDHRST